MKYSIVLFLCFCFVLFSCKKKKDETTTVNGTPFLSSNQYFPMAVGNYWIYQLVTIDTNGVETIDPLLDSVYISKDSVINGKTYFEVTGMVFFQAPSWKRYYRDSLQFVVDEFGTLIYAPEYFTDTMRFDTVPTTYTSFQIMKHLDSLVTVPYGNFITSSAERTVNLIPPYPWANPRFTHTLFSQYTGVVNESRFFVSSPDYMEGRLVRYYVQ